MSKMKAHYNLSIHQLHEMPGCEFEHKTPREQLRGVIILMGVLLLAIVLRAM